MADVAKGQADSRLRITEIFLSLQGESASVGWPTVFVRLTGCPLRCSYCDSSYAFSGGTTMSIESILGQVADYQARHVCVTGGEPLAQRACLKLLEALCEQGYEVSLETSGALDISGVDERVSRVVDLKTPGSGEEAKNRYQNLALLCPHDQLKVVLTGREDYEWALDKVAEYRLNEHCEVFFSAAFGELEPRQLADWIVGEHRPVRFQLQLHKILWGDEPGR